MRNVYISQDGSLPSFCRAAALALIAVLLASTSLRATETENNVLSVLPAPGKVTVDGKTDDWDLSGGVFACGDVETKRDTYATWIHAMYDADNLYILARWIDPTPMNNPGQVAGSNGFNGDCLQFRTITAAGTPQERGNHFTCWRDCNGLDVIAVDRGTKFDGGKIRDAKTQGAQQAFQKNGDGKGYVQEIAIPWKLLTHNGQPQKAGETFTITFEPNFTRGASGRLTIKDVFKAGMVADRVFTFMTYPCWGAAKLEPHGQITPHAVRLADAREFPVRIENGVPRIDWTGLTVVATRRGFKPITFTMPEDGYVSVQIVGHDGHVACQLVNGEFRQKGPQEVSWDGLSTMNWRTPGQPVVPGTYTVRALWHKEIGLRLKGWADNAATIPWDSEPQTNWGGDHGEPISCAAAGDRVFLGWSGAESGKALLACDLKGNVLWRNNRQGTAAAEFIAVDGDAVYAVNWGTEPGSNVLYRLNAQSGSYVPWPDGAVDLYPKDLFPNTPGRPNRMDGLAAGDGKLYMSLGAPRRHRKAANEPAATGSNAVAVVDAKTRKLLHTWPVARPRHLCAASPNLVYVVSNATSVIALDPTSGKTRTVIRDLHNASGISTDQQGQIYVAVREPENQIKVFTPDGKLVRTIGRAGGRRLIGPWQQDGMAFVEGIAVDREGKVWAAERDKFPKRISVWDAATGNFVQEFFGPTTYGALGGAISPIDPMVMIGAGSEWRLDPKTGHATCLGTITRDGMENSRFGIGANGKLYLAVASQWAHMAGPVRIFERRGDADYKLRAMFSYSSADYRDPSSKTTYWADENGDGQRQPNEVTTVPFNLHFSGWYMNFTPDMTIYGAKGQYAVQGFTPCGAPKYDLAHPVALPADGLGSADGKRLLVSGEYNTDCSWLTCFDIGSGRKLWAYPDNFVGVHGSHKACPPTVGMIRGSYNPCGTAKLPAPIGNVWVIPTNVGEWHILTEDGFYLTRLFQPDPMSFQWPAAAVPGAVMDNAPPGGGSEDFGGSICLAQDGKLYVQAGQTTFMNLEVVGLDTVRALPNSQVSISADDVAQAAQLRKQLLQGATGTQKLVIKRRTPAQTGNLDQDFAGATIISYRKQDSTAARSAAAWDDQNLYLAWDVRDATPWLNAAKVPEQMYTGGDTVDFQLGADPKADKNRSDAAQGDLRLSIGNFQGKPTAVIYRRVSTIKKPKHFSSGVVKDYPMDYVDVVPEAQIKVTVRPNSGYVVEAAIPLSALGLRPTAGLTLPADFGVTHGGVDNTRTKLRSYWNNQHTGIVDDVVFELMMEPKNWGQITFQP